NDAIRTELEKADWTWALTALAPDSTSDYVRSPSRSRPRAECHDRITNSARNRSRTRSRSHPSTNSQDRWKDRARRRKASPTSPDRRWRSRGDERARPDTRRNLSHSRGNGRSHDGRSSRAAHGRSRE
ncbi:unnamed protein product, partial [Pylaiella littoralis]